LNPSGGNNVSIPSLDVQSPQISSGVAS